jgi:ABC-type transport system involved in Fe-S cluster assembly fused permease/ATPase subunit
MTSYETVKYFNAETYESNRYLEAVEKYLVAERMVTSSLAIMNITQNTIFTNGLLMISLIAAWHVANTQQEVSKFVVLVTYMAQLQSPLDLFGKCYKTIQSAMINSERMLELFKEQPTVTDKEGAKELPTCQGQLRFQHVHFSYD